MKFIALYKTFRGGEWFETSLQSIASHVDGIVVVQSQRSWLNNGIENCSEVLDKFQEMHSHIPIIRISCETVAQEVQYREGIKSIIENFGPDAIAFIIDTDEIWTSEMLKALKESIKLHPRVERFYCSLKTYLKSPLYLVYPNQGGACVAVTHLPSLGHFTGRFLGPSRSRSLPHVHFHHFSYVRKDPTDIYKKFDTTASQEGVPSNRNWLRTIWQDLPWGHNLHMSQGYEHYWKQIKIITPAMLPIPLNDWLIKKIEEENEDWGYRMQLTPHPKTIVATPEWDKKIYVEEFKNMDISPIKTTLLEFLTLKYHAIQQKGPILEMGCGHGGSTYALALSNNPVDAVDPFEPYTEITHSGVHKDVREGNEKIFKHTIRRCHNVNLIKCHTTHSESFLRPKYKLIFVDANHSYESAKYDTELALRHLDEGGLLICHDYTTRFPGVIQALNELPINWRVFAGTTMAYYYAT